ncbi:hypothetical protein KY289_036382 [Solanum tuberosum]|nr:hypothetical protein KY289_036382 [Solanum tuberosum]
MADFTPVSYPPLPHFKMRLSRSYVTLNGMWLPQSISQYFPKNPTDTLLIYIGPDRMFADEHNLTVGSCGSKNRQRFSDG